MIRLLVKVYEINDSVEKKLMKYGDIELISEIFNLYSVYTSERNKCFLENIPDVISVRKEESCSLMSTI